MGLGHDWVDMLFMRNTALRGPDTCPRSSLESIRKNTQMTYLEYGLIFVFKTKAIRL